MLRLLQRFIIGSGYLLVVDGHEDKTEDSHRMDDVVVIDLTGANNISSTFLPCLSVDPVPWTTADNHLNINSNQSGSSFVSHNLYLPLLV